MPLHGGMGIGLLALLHIRILWHHCLQCILNLSNESSAKQIWHNRANAIGPKTLWLGSILLCNIVRSKKHGKQKIKKDKCTNKKANLDCSNPSFLSSNLTKVSFSPYSMQYGLLLLHFFSIKRFNFRFQELSWLVRSPKLITLSCLVWFFTSSTIFNMDSLDSLMIFNFWIRSYIILLVIVQLYKCFWRCFNITNLSREFISYA